MPIWSAVSACAGCLTQKSRAAELAQGVQQPAVFYFLGLRGLPGLGCLRGLECLRRGDRDAVGDLLAPTARPCPARGACPDTPRGNPPGPLHRLIYGSFAPSSDMVAGHQRTGGSSAGTKGQMAGGPGADQPGRRRPDRISRKGDWRAYRRISHAHRGVWITLCDRRRRFGRDVLFLGEDPTMPLAGLLARNPPAAPVRKLPRNPWHRPGRNQADPRRRGDMTQFPNRKIPTDLSLAGGSGSSGDCRAGGGQAASVRVTV
jgi:hypothetical protein